jgi:hypothetical protein
MIGHESFSRLRRASFVLIAFGIASSGIAAESGDRSNDRVAEAVGGDSEARECPSACAEGCFVPAADTPVTAFVAESEPVSALDRPPELLDHHQVAGTSSIRLLWAPGGNGDGTIDRDVVSYAVERSVNRGPFDSILTADRYAMTHVDSVEGLRGWNGSRPVIAYRVRALTNDGGQSLSSTASLSAAVPLYPPAEVLNGAVRLAWQSAAGVTPCSQHSGYEVQKLVDGLWQTIGATQHESFIDHGATVGVNRYRVRSLHSDPTCPPGTSCKVTLTSNEQQIELHPTCAGQIVDPTLPPLSTIEIGDLDADGDHDGDDVAAALVACAKRRYERIDGKGDDDGICEAGESCVTGGCVLRVLPRTYDDVAIMITDLREFCDDPDLSTRNTTQPNHCLTLDFPAGLVIEGYGRESVLRSPLWTPPHLPAAILEVHRKRFQITLRNLVLDGRKHEQRDPAMHTWANWYHSAFTVWNSNPWGQSAVEVIGDSLGNDDGNCDWEPSCTEDTVGNDRDGVCEAGERCVGTGGKSCVSERYPDAEACVGNPAFENNDGCIHNVEARNIFSAFAISLGGARRWIVEDSELHDVGCVNRGFGYDCPKLEAAPDVLGFSGFKTFGIGLNVFQGTSDFKVRRNTVYRVTKYGLSFKNGDATNCDMLLRNHEVAYNDLRDVGTAGILSVGTVGARIHHNTISGTTTWNAPPSKNGDLGPFGMFLGGYCSDDNEISDNVINDSGGIGILWNGSTRTVACSSPGDCAPLPAIGNTIRNTTIDGTCLEKVTGPEAPNAAIYGSILVHMDAAGPLYLIDDTLTNSRCRHAVNVFGPRNASVGPLELRVIGGSYESGPHAAAADQSFYCGAVHAYGANRRVVIEGGASISNPTGLANIPKACHGYGATFVVDDVPSDPFAAGRFADFGPSNGGSRVTECSAHRDHPECR